MIAGTVPAGRELMRKEGAVGATRVDATARRRPKKVHTFCWVFPGSWESVGMMQARVYATHARSVSVPICVLLMKVVGFGAGGL